MIHSEMREWWTISTNCDKENSVFLYVVIASGSDQVSFLILFCPYPSFNSVRLIIEYTLGFLTSFFYHLKMSLDKKYYIYNL